MTDIDRKTKDEAILNRIVQVGVVLMFAVTIATSLGWFGPVGPDVTVTYDVSGTTSEASLTYDNDQGGTEQQEVRVPWRKTLKVRPGQYVYLLAQNRLTDGSVVCSILLDGQPWRRSESSGSAVIATCSGRAGQ